MIVEKLSAGYKKSDNAPVVPLPEVPVQTGNAGTDDRHFRTDHLLADLKNRTVSSGFITIVSQGVQFTLTLASTMILARLLTPHDFGLVAMVWTVMGFLRVFKEAGLSTATVQREGITHAQVSNLFWINLAVSGFISLLVAAAAPLIAWFYREPRLVGITVALSIVFFLSGSAVQHMALLNRQMRFKVIALIQVGSLLAGVLTGVGMAWFNCGYWSLVGLNLTTNLVALLMTWSASRWRPQFFTLRSGTRPLVHFGANLTAGSFFYSLARGLDGLLIGRFYGAVSVGLYSRAMAMLSRPMEQFMCPIEAVFIPAFSRLQAQPERYRRSFLQVYETIALVSFFFTGMFFSLAHPLTLVVLGPKWEKAAVIFAGLTFAALQYPLGSCASWLLTSQGRGRHSFLASVIISIIIAASFVAGLPYGPAGVAIAYSASCLLIQTPVYYWLVGRRGPVSTSDLWMGFLKHLPVWGVVTLVTWLARLTMPNNQAFKELLVGAPCGLLAGVAFVFIYPASRRVAVNVLSIMHELRHAGDNPEEGQGGDQVIAAAPAVGRVAVSVVIPTYNREAFVVKAVDSVLKQTFTDYEIIVVDDGSTDGTRSVLQPYLDRIKYIYQNNAGVGAARNAGLKVAAGEWVAFLDSDDEWTPGYLAKQMEAASRNPDICMQIADCRYADSEGEQASYFEVNGTSREFDGADYLRPREPFVFLIRHLSWQIGSTVIRREAVSKAGPFNEDLKISEDQDFMARVALVGPVGLLKSKLMTAHRRSEPIENLSLIARANPVQSRRSDERMYQRLGSLPNLSRNERQIMKWVRSANQRAIGNQLVAEGKFQEARNAFWMAVILQPSARSIGKYLLSFLWRRSSRIHSRSPGVRQVLGK